MREALIALAPWRRDLALGMMPEGEAGTLDRDWPSWAHDGQLPPACCPDGSDWRTWVIIAGRGFGKTRAGAEWLAAELRAATVSAAPPPRIALVAATLDEARRVMVEGTSGLLSVAPELIAEWRPSLRALRFVGGGSATLFSGASPQGLRGPEHSHAWCDELAKWHQGDACWDMLQLGLRLGGSPRALVTTTPRPGPTLQRILAAPGCVPTGGPTWANPHLPRAFRDHVAALYSGTRLGEQELEGRLLTDVPGALWTADMLAAARIASLPQAGGAGGGTGQDAEEKRQPTPVDHPPTPFLARADTRYRAPPALYRHIVIGVDPPSGDGTCGIVACAIDADDMLHVLGDHSVTGLSPQGWAGAVAHAVRRWGRVGGGVLVVAEANQGGQMVESVLRTADAGMRLRLVHAHHGKSQRAEPVAMLFEQGRVRLHGRMEALEAELGAMIAGGGYAVPGTSPDRADAMVWALAELVRGAGRVPRVRAL